MAASSSAAARVLVLGGGFVGTVTAVVLSEQGHQVALFEKDPDRRRALQEGRPPFVEPGLKVALASQLRRRLTVPELVEPADVAIVCVGTPGRRDGAADLDQVVAACRAAAEVADVIAIKSTVPPGTVDEIAAMVDVPVASLPEFLAEGEALAGARAPHRVVIGCRDATVAAQLQRLHPPAPVIVTAPSAAEAIKHCSNAMLAARVGMVNELANVCERLGLAADDVLAGVGLDPRIGDRFLTPGLGFGGSCFPKDVRALRHLARTRGQEMPILEAVLAANDRQPLRAVAVLREELGDLRGRRIALLGLSFKSGTSDLRESRAVVLHDALQEAGAEVIAHDPAAGPAFAAARPDASVEASAAAAIAGADACVIATPWPEYEALDWEQLAPRMRGRVILDAWRALDAAALPTQLRYRALGRPARQVVAA